MPRRNKTPKHITYQPPIREVGKVRYRTKQDAEKAIKETLKYNHEAKLRAYKSPYDPYWYLTSTN